MTALMYAVVHSHVIHASGSYLTKNGFEIIDLLFRYSADDEVEDNTKGGIMVLKSDWTYVRHGRTVCDFINNQFDSFYL
jgi:hypothetical protein